MGVQGLVTVGLEILGLLVAIVVVRRVLRERGSTHGSLSGATAVVVGVLVLVLGAESLAASSTELAAIQRGSVGAQQGLDYCVGENHAQVYIPFFHWLRSRLPRHAVYEVVDQGAPDAWCLALELLPRLPAFGRAHAGWLVDIEDITPDLRARIARRDPNVFVYVPGLVLERLAP